MTRNLPSGTVTFLFTDIEGSTKLAQQYPEAWESLRQRHDAILRVAVAAHNGYVFKTIGDAICVAFSSASDGLNSALDAQRSLQAESWDAAPVRVRMGLHTGEAELLADGDYTGYLALSRAQRLMSAGHGGQVLISNSTQELIRDDLPDGVTLRDMGERKLKDLIRPEHIYQLVVSGLAADFPPLKSLEGYRHNLPAQMTSFIGREKEIAQVKTELGLHRLVTLIGPGGTGKTRLSLQVAAELLDSFPDGIWFVELAPLADPGLIPQTVLSVLGVPEQNSRSALVMLEEYLKDRKLLILLDNCEHLILAASRVAGSLLNGAPGLKILATSREALGVPGELAWHVASLAAPDPQKLPQLEQLTQYESVRLFIDRASLANPHFAVTRDNAPAIAQICYRLDGISLALELAAARVKLLSVDQISVRLDDRFRLLTGGARTALPRQQTLRALIDWSYDLLSENERLLLCRLAVFMGGWTLELAEQVCPDERIDQYEILDMLGRLVDKSLVAVDESSSGTRYRILETIRQYAREKLSESGEGEKVRDQHLKAIIELAEKAEPEIRGPDQLVWLDRLDDEVDNLRAAMEFAFSTRNVEAGLYLASNFGRRFWEYHGVREGLAWLTRFLDLSQSKSFPVARAKALYVQAGLLWNSQRFGEARQRAEESLALFRTRGDQQGEIEALLSLAGPMQYLEGADRTVELEQEALRLARSIGDVWREAKALGALGWDDRDLEKRHENWREAIRLFRQVGDLQDLEFHLGALGESLALRGEVEAAEKHLVEAHEINQRTHNRRASEFALNAYGYLALIDRDYARARACFAENVQNMDELGNRIGYLWARGRLGFALLLQGSIAEAREIVLQTLQDFHREGNGSGVLFLIPKVAGLRVVENEHECAARLIGWADSRQRISRPAGDQMAVDQDIEAIRAKIGEAAYEEAHRQGSTMTRDEAVSLALRET